MPDNKQSKRILIAAGGTGGHLYPAQALAGQLIKTDNPPEVLFAGGGLATSHFFDRSRFAFKEIDCSALSKNPVKFIRSSFRILKGLRQSLKIIRDFKPDIVVGFGSYHSVPLLLASKLCKVPFVIHEANSIPGKANKWLAPYATYVGVHFPFTASLLKGRIVEVGLPIREGYDLEVDKWLASDYYGFSGNEFTVLIFGGSQGASAINQLMEEALPYLNGLKIRFIHFIGKNEHLEQMSDLYKKYLFSVAVKNFESNMHFAWKSADLFIGRAGASTIAEAMAFEVPGILIPYPHATDNHQHKNAEFLSENIQGGVTLNQHGLTGRGLADEIKRMMPGNLRASMKARIRSYKKHPKQDLCQLVLNVIS